MHSERVGFDRIHVFTRQVEAAFAKHNAFNLSGEFNLTRHAPECHNFASFAKFLIEHRFQTGD